MRMNSVNDITDKKTCLKSQLNLSNNDIQRAHKLENNKELVNFCNIFKIPDSSVLSATG